MDDKRLRSLAAELIEIRGQKDKLDEQKKQLNVREEVVRKELADTYIEHEIQRMTFEGLGTFYIQTESKYSVPAECQMSVMDVILAKGIDGVIETKVSTSKLKSYVKEHGNIELKDALREAGVSIYEYPDIRVRK